MSFVVVFVLFCFLISKEREMMGQVGSVISVIHNIARRTLVAAIASESAVPFWK